MDATIKHKQELLKIHRRRLYILQLNAAHFGANVPPEITIEIEDIEKKLEILECELVVLLDKFNLENG